MHLVYENSFSFFKFPNLAAFPEVVHAIFTRHGGHSKPPFQSLNVSFSVGDDPECVRKNKALILDFTGNSELVFTNQVHGTGIWVLSDNTLHMDKASPPSADAMITNLPGKTLMIKAADCQPVLLYDPPQKVIANVHSGWRGSVRNILGNTVEKMASVFGSRPRDVIAGIGPSLGPCCAEFTNYQKEIPPEFWCHKDGGDHFDFWSISKNQLRDAGVLEKNILVSGICTQCRPDLFFSYRKEKMTGRFAAVIGLKG